MLKKSSFDYLPLTCQSTRKSGTGYRCWLLIGYGDSLACTCIIFPRAACLRAWLFFARVAAVERRRRVKLNPSVLNWNSVYQSIKPATRALETCGESARGLGKRLTCSSPPHSSLGFIGFTSIYFTFAWVEPSDTKAAVIYTFFWNLNFILSEIRFTVKDSEE